jgi:hypothetical protein
MILSFGFCQINFYRQFLLNKFSVEAIKAGKISWISIRSQILKCVQYQELLLRAEYNHVRYYLYAHSEAITNYRHNNQSLEHQ